MRDKISEKTTKLYVRIATAIMCSSTLAPVVTIAATDYGKTAGKWILRNAKWGIGAILIAVAGVMLVKKETVKAIGLLIAAALVIFLMSTTGITTLTNLGENLKGIFGI